MPIADAADITLRRRAERLLEEAAAGQMRAANRCIFRCRISRAGRLPAGKISRKMRQGEAISRWRRTDGGDELCAMPFDDDFGRLSTAARSTITFERAISAASAGHADDTTACRVADVFAAFAAAARLPPHRAPMTVFAMGRSHAPVASVSAGASHDDATTWLALASRAAVFHSPLPHAY